MKNPLTYLKHIVKDPINNIAEADARKKEIMPLFYPSLGLLVVGIILQLVLEGAIASLVTSIGGIGVAFCAFLFWVIKKAKERFKGLTCNKCNAMANIDTPEDFAKYVSYTITEDKATFKGNVGNKEATNGVYSLVKYVGTSYATVLVDITCPSCGEVKHLKYTCTPFECHAEAKNVGALRMKEVCDILGTAVSTVVNEYNDPDKKESVPYSIHSTKNPNFENRTTFAGANAKDARPEYKGAKITMHQDVEEMLEHYFVLRQINGKLKEIKNK